MHTFNCPAGTAGDARTGACGVSRAKGQSVRLAALGALAVGLLLLAAPTQAAFNVRVTASGAASGGAWSGNTWTANAGGATVPASEVAAHLATGATLITTGSGGGERGNIVVEGNIAWSANALTLNAGHDITIGGALTGTGTATLALEYGQGAVAAGNTAVYRFNTPVRLTSYSGDPYGTANFSTKRGSDGVVASRAVPACSSSRGTSSCPFLKSPATFVAENIPEVFNIEYRTVEVSGTADATTWLYFNANSLFAGTYYPYVMSCVAGVGQFYYPGSTQQASYFGAGGVITDLANLDKYTTTTRVCKEFDLGPIMALTDSASFPNGYMIKYVPGTGAYGNAEHVLPVLITGADVNNTGYTVLDLVVNVRPHAPTATGASDITITAPAASGTTDVTLAGSGDLTVSATSSNLTLLPSANITGAASCTAAGACTLTVASVAGRYGTATVTVAVADAWGQQAGNTFTVTVLPPAPAISGTAHLNLLVAEPGSESVTLSGTGTLALAATSSNTTLLPNANITQSAGCSAAGACALTLTPAAGRTGTTTVTLQLDDLYGRSVTTSFNVTVSIPAAPDISAIPDLSLTAPQWGSTTFTLTGTGPLAVSVTPVGAAGVVGSVLGAGNCTAAGSCTLTVTPAANQYGTATLRVTVADSYGQSASKDFVVSVSRPAAPAVTGAGDVNLIASTTGHTAFTLAGTGALTVSATSDNVTLLPDAAITGAAACTAAGGCTLWLAPSAAQSGTATVTVTVDDTFGQRSTATFALNVTPTAGVIYDGNGATDGSAPVDGAHYALRSTVTVLDAGTLTRAGYTFVGWNTARDGSGAAYAAGDTFAIANFVTLYAQWRAQTTTVTLGGGSLSFEGLALLALLLGGRRLRRAAW
jgi:uncharacterized repeat protein (TIGR02543 family)